MIGFEMNSEFDLSTAMMLIQQWSHGVLRLNISTNEKT